MIQLPVQSVAYCTLRTIDVKSLGEHKVIIASKGEDSAVCVFMGTQISWGPLAVLPGVRV